MRVCVLRMPVSSPLWCSLRRPARRPRLPLCAVANDSTRARARASWSHRRLRRPVERLALRPDLDVDEIAADGARIDRHGKPGSIRKAQQAVRTRHQVIAGDLEGKRLGFRGELAELV